MQHNYTTTEGREFLLIEVPESALRFRLIMKNELAWESEWNRQMGGLDGTSIPYGNYTIHGKLKDQPPELPTTVELLEFVREKGLNLNQILVLEKVK